MGREVFIGVFVGFPFIGFIHLIYQSSILHNKKVFTQKYLKKLKTYISSSGEDEDSMYWILQKLDKIQSEVGILGIASQYKPPYKDLVITNYQIIINEVSSLIQALERRSSYRIIQQKFTMIETVLIRHIGVVDDAIKKTRAKLFNPLAWFTSGVGVVLSLPLYILNWFGILDPSSVKNIQSSGRFGKVRKALSIIIVVGANLEGFIQLISRFIN